jgi:hypothetical protein
MTKRESLFVNNKKILFLGDSFISAADKLVDPVLQGKRYGTISYLDLVAEKIGLDYICLGFGGKSWWFCRSKMFEYFNKHNITVDNIEVLVLVNSSMMRFPSSNINIKSSIDNNTPEIKRALELYYTTLCDTEFHIWAYEKFLKEIKETFTKTKIISLYSFMYESIFIDKMPGTVFSTPLSAISFSEFDGHGDPIKSIHQAAELDSNGLKKRANHLNNKNNSVLADHIIGAINNYNVGIRNFDLTKFDIVDKNTFEYAIDFRNFSEPKL